MNILAFDTCFDCCSVAAGRRLRSLIPSIAYATEPMATGHAERLIPMIKDVMGAAGLSFHELNRIVLTHGPGTFTGARISVSAARALSLATGAPLVAISSLQLMAFNPRFTSDGAGTIAVATDARRGEVYFQVFDPRSIEPKCVPQLLSAREAAAQLGDGRSVVAGSGAEAVADEAQAMGFDVHATLPDLLPDAIDMLFASFSWPVDAARIAPLYLRPPDAKPPRPIVLGKVIA